MYLFVCLFVCLFVDGGLMGGEEWGDGRVEGEDIFGRTFICVIFMLCSKIYPECMFTF